MAGTLITVVHISICVFLIMLVLLQQGKGADMGATFGGGSNTLFGAGGADTLLTKVTTAIAIGFMFTSVTLAVRGRPVAPGQAKDNLFQDQTAPISQPAVPQAPSADTSAAPSEGTASEPAAEPQPAAE